MVQFDSLVQRALGHISVSHGWGRQQFREIQTKADCVLVLGDMNFSTFIVRNIPASNVDNFLLFH